LASGTHAPEPGTGPFAMETPLELALWLSLPLLMILSAIASGSETALFSITSEDRAALHQLGRLGPAAALLARPRLLLIQILVLNMTINVLYFVVSTLLAFRAGSAAEATAISVASVVGIIVFGEVIAKVAASSRRVAVTAAVAGPMLVLQRVGWPVFFSLDRFVIGPLTRLVHPAGSGAAVNREELTRLVHAEGGVLDEAERGLLAEVLELRVRRARDVMTPRVDLRTVTEAWTLNEVRAIRRGRIPVSPDGLTSTVRGTIDARAALSGQRRDTVVSPPVFVPEAATLDQVLEHFGRKNAELAYCVAERGEITGMVTIDDIVDELAVGAAFGERPVQIGRGAWRIGGRMGLRDFAEAFEVPDIDEWLGSTRVSTVGGLVSETLGRIPEAGDEIRFGGFRFRVHAVKGRSVDAVEVRMDEGGEA